MDIDQFYDEDPRRRHSEEVVFGDQWIDDDGDRWRIGWIRDTGELWAMFEPAEIPVSFVPPAGPQWWPPVKGHDVTTFVLATISDEARVRELVGDWQSQQNEVDGFEQLASRLDEAGYPPPW